MKRTKYSADKKAQIVLQNLRGTSIGELSREYGISSGLIHKWKDQFTTNMSTVFEGNKEVEQSKKKIEEYEKTIGKLVTQNDFLEHVLKTLD